MSLRLETDSSHVSNCPLLLHSQLAGFELHYEPLTSGIERLIGILEDVLDAAVDVFVVPKLLH